MIFWTIGITSAGKHLNNGKLYLNEEGSVKLSSLFLYDILGLYGGDKISEGFSVEIIISKKTAEKSIGYFVFYIILHEST